MGLGTGHLGGTPETALRGTSLCSEEHISAISDLTLPEHDSEEDLAVKHDLVDMSDVVQDMEVQEWTPPYSRIPGVLEASTNCEQGTLQLTWSSLFRLPDPP